MKKAIVISVIVIAVVGLSIFFALGMKGKDDGPKGDVVRIENPERGELVESVNAPGEVEPRSKVNISARISARIIELPFLEGARVTGGDPHANPPVAPSVLVRLDSTEFEAALKSAEATRAAQAARTEVEKAQIAGRKADLEGIGASLKKAELDLTRCTGLLESSDIAQSEVDAARSCYDELKARRASAEYSLVAAEKGLTVLEHNLEAAEADIARAKDALSYTTITSPIDGVVTRLNAKVGELVMTGTMNNPGTVIMQVADLSEMLIVLQVDEADVGKIAVGQDANVRIHAYQGEKFHGTVESIALTHDATYAGAKYFKTRILLDPVGRSIYSGLTADVDILTRRHSDIIKVPSQAILGRPVDDLPLSIREDNPNVDLKKTYATVVYRFIDGKAVVTPVTIGASDATHTVILSGLDETDRVVTGPYKVLEGIQHDKNLQDEREVEKKKKAEEAASQASAESADETADSKPDSEGSAAPDEQTDAQVSTDESSSAPGDEVSTDAESVTAEEPQAQ